MVSERTGKVDELPTPVSFIDEEKEQSSPLYEQALVRLQTDLLSVKAYAGLVFLQLHTQNTLVMTVVPYAMFVKQFNGPGGRQGTDRNRGPPNRAPGSQRAGSRQASGKP